MAYTFGHVSTLGRQRESEALERKLKPIQYSGSPVAKDFKSKTIDELLFENEIYQQLLDSDIGRM